MVQKQITASKVIVECACSRNCLSALFAKTTLIHKMKGGFAEQYMGKCAFQITLPIILVHKVQNAIFL
jgi:hypothetical protein